MVKSDFFNELFEFIIINSPNKHQISREKARLSKIFKLKSIPTDIEVMLNADKETLDIIKPFLITKPVRTQSGVTVIAIMTPPAPCPHGKCAYCPGGPNSKLGNVPQSYTGHEPSTMRGIRNEFNPYLMVMNRLEQYTVLGHSHDKVELIIMGGTFLSVDKEFQRKFVAGALKAMNDFSKIFYKDNELDLKKFKEFFELPGKVGDDLRVKSIHSKLKQQIGQLDLETEKLRNETAIVRCIGLTIETRPDWGMEEHTDLLLELGATRVELGIQSVYNDVLEKIKRGHTVEQSIKSMQVLKDAGFKIVAHMMPGLPLTDRQRDIDGLNELFKDQKWRPDMLKLYPCMVAKGTELYNDFENKLFTPISTKEAALRIAEFKKEIPTYCRVQRVQRDVPTKLWSAGVNITNLRQYIHEKLKPVCKCIRCREPKGKIPKGDGKIIVNEYEASNGTEFFISYEEENIVYGYCRLRFPATPHRKEITKDSAIIRELHVFGSQTKIGHEGKVQHIGLGSKLLKKAEEIAKHNQKSKMVVISGIGVKQYYRNKHNYENDGPYVSKTL